MRFDSSAKFALVVAGAALLLSALGFRAAVGRLNVYLRKEPVPLRAPLATLPSTVGPWKQLGDDRTLSSAVVEELGTAQYVDRNYERAGVRDDVLALHIAYYTGMIDAVPHVPERCWVANGLIAMGSPQTVPLDIDRGAWRFDDGATSRGGEAYPSVEVPDPISRRPMLVHLPLGDFALTAAEYQSETRPDERMIGGYFFLANGRATPSGLGVRTLAFQPTQRAAYYCKVQLAMPCRANDPDRWSRFARYSGEFVSQLLPQLMRRLPDWPAVEHGDAATSPPAAGAHPREP
ncbi:MAG: exosortase-associated EpsI family protein [Phycisphaerales bacterium]